MDKELKIIQQLLDDELIDKYYVSVLVDLAIIKATENFGKELGYKIPTEIIRKYVEDIVK